MKISYNWLKDYLDLNMPARELADRLSLAGLEVEEVAEKSLALPEVVIGRVLSCDPHPDADKLHVCRVDLGIQELSIVCGAPNVATDQVVPVAKVGASLPNGLKIRKAKIRGVASEGMICSEQELGLADHSDGIWILPENLPLGVPIDEALDFQTDYILDIAITPNRPDCLSHIGVAREVGAILDQHIVKPDVSLMEIAEPADGQVKIEIENPEGCPRYSARVIRNIKVGESPTWLVRRLEAVGVRSINNVVDVTNYVMMETGHPLHAFDYDLVEDHRIIVRDSKAGEKFTTLDDKERQLKEGTVLICDGKRPVAIGGIMGGLNSEVTKDTTKILLESAYFNPVSIQKSSRYLGLSSEASQRFERGADPNGTVYALDRAARMMAEICQGENYSGIVDVHPKPISPREIPLKTDKINNLLGTDLTTEAMADLLSSIDLKVENDSVIVPTFRPDLERVADLAEEVARLYGLENIESHQQLTIEYSYIRNEFDLFIDKVKDILTGMGLQEIIAPSMVNGESWEKITGGKLYPILNPISKDMDALRNSLLPSLANIIQYNLNRQMRDMRMFEINRVFTPPEKAGELPAEEIKLGIAMCGKRDGDLWYSTHQDNDFYDIKGIVETLLHKISLDNWQLISYSDNAIEGEGLAISTGKMEVGFIGELSSSIAAFFEIEDAVMVGEISVDRLFKHCQTARTYSPVPRFPWVDRDLALVVDEELEIGKLVDVIRQKGGKLLTNVEIFDIYRGKQIPPEKKSVAFRLIFQSLEGTLTEETVSKSMAKILNAVSETYDAKLRA